METGGAGRTGGRRARPQEAAGVELLGVGAAVGVRVEPDRVGDGAAVGFRVEAVGDGATVGFRVEAVGDGTAVGFPV
ncbi:hypothetical protein L3i22_050250 [Actinoplanes sp. L3-i22]|nr:hypothetical protein L3i22_050250 [Actinoplanes sp. L3-i22]